ncbi:MAG TPA: DUF3035 domain-containing protein [Dongiaceae bacterium]|jgi:hypothetical protein|nr:DUF3035 domain-containing protein [Dongiaceae bacterium]
MPRLAFPLALALLGLGLAGCQNAKEMLGLTKRSPDEFQVVSRAPLSMPPDYSLRPPTPGAPRPQEGTVQQQAQSIVTGHADRNTLAPDQIPSIGEGEQTTAESAGEAAFLQSASLSGVDPNIRKLVDQETAADEESSKSVLDDLIFWRKPEPYGTVVDPVAEQKRLQENQALGQPVETGNTPIIERKQKGLLEGLF